jgi:glycosyltransferase involved in cell wall biosynthesis
MRVDDVISVVIPAWNEEKYIGAALEALFAAAENLKAAGGEAEVIVVDNASSDATAERAARFGVKVIREEERRIATVRNAGARAATGGFLAFLDADSRPSPNALVRIRETLSSGQYLGGGVRIRPEKWTLAAAPAFAGLRVVERILGISAGMVFATREAFDAVGGFDESVYASEDLRFVLALREYARKCGKKFANLSDVSIITSIRKYRRARLGDLWAMPRYIFDRKAVEERRNCGLWYDERYR